MLSEFSAIHPDCEIVSSRIFNATPDVVFRAWTEPEHLKKWWGPAGFTSTFIEFDFRVGGKWNFIMHGPEKGNYRNECEFIKIEKPGLVAWKRHSHPLFKVMATFDEVSPGKTKVLFRMIFDSKKECDKIRPYATPKNEENFDRLEKELLNMKSKFTS